MQLLELINIEYCISKDSKVEKVTIVTDLQRSTQNKSSTANYYNKNTLYIIKNIDIYKKSNIIKRNII